MIVKRCSNTVSDINWKANRIYTILVLLLVICIFRFNILPRGQ